MFIPRRGHGRRNEIHMIDFKQIANDLSDEYVAVAAAANALSTYYTDLMIDIVVAAPIVEDDGNQAEIDLANWEADLAVTLDTSFPSKPGVFEREGRVYRIKPGSNWAKVLQPDGNFVYVGNVNRMVRECDRIDMARALELSAQMSSCCMCGRTLTDPQSVAVGIGPVCAKRAA